MGILTSKKATTPVAQIPALTDQLFAASDAKAEEKYVQLTLAEDLRSRADNADARAAVAGKHSDALADALRILDEAGVTL